MSDLPDLVERAHTALAQASVLPEASAMNLEPRTSHGKPDSGHGPSGQAFGLYDAIKHRIAEAHNDRRLREAVEWAEEQIWAIRKTRRPKVDLGTKQGRLEVGLRAIALDEVGEAAKEYRIPVSSVYRYRSEAREYLSVRAL